MLPLRHLQGARSRIGLTCRHALERRAGRSPLPLASLVSSRPPILHGHGTFSTAAHLRAEESPQSGDARSPEDIERTVREAAERWKDTLPKDYLSPEEMVVYERLFGPPLRETEPEDVGIPSHADMGNPAASSDDAQTLLRIGEDGQMEEMKYETTSDEASQAQGAELAEEAAVGAFTSASAYVDAVARNPREHAALLKLSQDFEAAQKKQLEAEQKATEEMEAEERAADESTALGEGEVDSRDTPAWRPARQAWNEDEEDGGDEDGTDEREPGKLSRFHRHTLAGHYHESPVEISLPGEQLLNPIRRLLSRSDPSHIRDAAEEAFGGPGLPTSPTTPTSLRKGKMVGVGLHPDKRRMTEIEADAFLAGYLPPAYSSIMSILREVRRRLGSHWLQSRLKMGKDGNLSVLDVGGGGAGLVAWDAVLRAEWEVLKQDGQVHGASPPQWAKTAVIGSERLRNRVKSFLENTTFLPRLPDYEHSGQTHGEHLEAGDQPQPRKQYDIVIASHLFLQEQVGHRRQAVLNALWNTLSKDGGILIIIEKPHPRGFEAVAHARDTILKQFLESESGESNVKAEKLNPAFHRALEPGHVIAPCTTQGTCPMYRYPGESQGRKDMCHFTQRFVKPVFYRSVMRSVLGGEKSSMQGTVRFSYVAIRRGVPRNAQLSGKEATRRAFDSYEGTQETPDMQSLPRLILRPLKRTGHVTMDVCTAEGILERWTVPKSYSKQAYHDARKSQWGDLWALGAKTRVMRRVRDGQRPTKEGKRSGKKPHKVQMTMEGGRVYAKEKNGPKDRAAQRRGKARDPMQELMDAEEQEETALSQAIDEGDDDDEDDDDDGEDDSPRRRKPRRGRRRG